MSWYYAIGDERRGPITDAEFQVFTSNGTIRVDTLVWRDGMADWVPYGALTGGVPNYSGEPGMRYAGFWIRFAAKLIDLVILNVASFFIGLAAELVGAFLLPDDMETVVTITVYAISIIISLSYYVLFVGAYGATPGKMLLSLRVVRSDGTPVSYGRALGRYVAAALNYLTLFMGWFMVGWNQEKCGLHDYICNTRVIHTD